jgi:DNA-binding response OmpR family regulator
LQVCEVAVRRAEKARKRCCLVESVLLVEDEWLIALAQTEALTAAGYLVHPVSSGAAALAVAKTVGLSAAIIDMGLPDCGGDQVARELRAISSLLPILICTGFASASVAKELKAIGVCIVEKPVDEGSLISTLREHIRTVSKPISLARRNSH